MSEFDQEDGHKKSHQYDFLAEAVVLAAQLLVLTTPAKITQSASHGTCTGAEKTCNEWAIKKRPEYQQPAASILVAHQADLYFSLWRDWIIRVHS